MKESFISWIGLKCNNAYDEFFKGAFAPFFRKMNITFTNLQ